MSKKDYATEYFGTDLGIIDPDVQHIIDLEEERQARRIILIPSESLAPAPVRAALGSVFNNIYAEGYPPTHMVKDNEELLLEFDHELAGYRRYADRRFYKGADYVNLIETLAQRRAAALFATPEVPAEHLFVNVQALSGAAANLAVYDSIMQPGDTLMGMDLFQGGHLTHGSEFNLSGKRYRVASYGVSKTTEKLDYDAIRALALEARPKVIVAGFTSFPWAPDWAKFRAIADEVGAYLMADISHPAGLTAAGYFPNPVGYADVITFTTHKTLCGPRGAVIMTPKRELAEAIDLAVFPGAQGGPHTNKFAAMCVAFKIDQTPEFRQVMRRIVDNAQALAGSLKAHGLGLVYGGGDTHLLMVDLRPIKGKQTGNPLLAEVVVRVMELCGLVANKNTVPGDDATATARGVRLGTPWVSQRGMGPAEMDRIAGAIAKLIQNIEPFTYEGLIGTLPRGKLPLDVLEEVKADVAALAAETPAETKSRGSGYPHYYIMDESKKKSDEREVVAVWGDRAEPFIQQTCSVDVAHMGVGDTLRSFMLDKDGLILDDVFVQNAGEGKHGWQYYLLAVHGCFSERVKAWLRGLADGYIFFDNEDIYRKVEGPVVVADVDAQPELKAKADEFLNKIARADRPTALPKGTTGKSAFGSGHKALFGMSKSYFVGQSTLLDLALKAGDKKEWSWVEPTDAPVKRTCLYEEHAKRTKKIIPFAGWEMPVWYTSVSDEHRATRETAALYDVSHMGVLSITGPFAEAFLDVVSTNYVRWLEDGQSHYAYLLDPDGDAIDDIMVYRRGKHNFLMVINAANADKDWNWLNAVNDGRVVIDRANPSMVVEGKATLKNLKDPAMGAEQKVDIALQGPVAREVLLRLADDAATRTGLARMPRTDLMDARCAGLNLVIARTGYTGEDVGYEIFVHPAHAPKLWNAILEAGADLGVKPAGLGARDSTRTEAGLPLYGHAIAGHYGVLPAEAGFGSYVKLHKPFFIGRSALVEKMKKSSMQVVRFRMNQKGVRMAKTGDPVVNPRGRCIGFVTSCSMDLEGYLVGLAYVERKQAKEGAEIGIFVLPERPAEEKPRAEFQPGDSTLLPSDATILPRFPNK